MAWVRFDDKFWRNEKMRKLSHAARGVFLDSVTFCGDDKELTGFLTVQQALDRATGQRRLVTELVDNNNLEVVNGGYLIHDFDEYIPKTSRDRTRAWREKKRLECHGDVTPASQNGHGDNGLSRARDGKPVPVPEPVPVKGVLPPVVPLTTDEPKYGIPKTSMHVSGLGPLSETLKNVVLQPMPRKEATG